MSDERQFEDSLCKTLYKDKQSAATKRKHFQFTVTFFKRQNSASADSKSKTKFKSSWLEVHWWEHQKEKDEKIGEELWTPK